MTVATSCLEIDLFETDLGWYAAAIEDDVVRRIVIGHGSPAGARRALLQRLETESAEVVEADDESLPAAMLRSLLQGYSRGEPVDFSQVCVDLSHLTPFQSRIVRIVRRIPYGRTLSYGEVAKKAGSPRAARAVGSVMANNRYPIVIPCHRVVAAGGGLGGFSAPGGVRYKERLLGLESRHARGETE